MIELGSEVKDRVTGVEGIAIARNFWMNGCIRYGIQAKAKEDGKVPDVLWVDQEQIIILKPVKTKSKESGGGIRQDPQY